MNNDSTRRIIGSFATSDGKSCFHPPRWTRLALGVLTAVSMTVTPGFTTPEAPPNIVLIVSDDQGYKDFGFMGSGDVKTPHLDRLADLSALYPNSYVTSSICRPSLATIMTGLYPHQHGIHFNHPPPGLPWLHHFNADEYTVLRNVATHLIQSVPTIPRVLSRAGYRCLQTGKHWEGAAREAGFTEGLTRARPHPLEGAIGLRPHHGNGDAGLQIGRYTMDPIFEFIDRNEEKPFFIWYSPYLPHVPHNPPARFRALYEDQHDLPFEKMVYYASCSWFDDTVGRLVRYIENKGLAHRTLFVFISDNGYAVDEQGLVNQRGKMTPYESGLRTPILLRWDGVIQPSRHSPLCSSVDIAPTIFDVAGHSNLAQDLPGLSLLPSARGTEPLPDRTVFGGIYPGDASGYGNPSSFIAYRWLRQGPYKLIVPHVHDALPWGEYELGTALYDVRNDPDEAVDLAARDESRDVILALTRRLDAWWTPGDDSGVARPEQRKIRSAWKDAIPD